MKKIYNKWDWDDIGYACIAKSKDSIVEFSFYREYNGITSLEKRKVYLTENNELTTELDKAKPFAIGEIGEFNKIKIKFLCIEDEEFYTFDDVFELTKFKDAIIRLKDSIAFIVKKRTV